MDGRGDGAGEFVRLLAYVNGRSGEADLIL
jgi:hypothetical protein